MNVLITGSSGQLGTKFRELFPIFDHCIYFTPFFTDSKTLNIADEKAVKEYVRDNEIDVILNFAAYTNVDKAEENPELAKLVNTTACRYLAEAIKERNGYLIHISTDYVFNGQNPTPRKPGDETDPIGVYGKTKLEGEKEIIASGCHYIIIRTSWLYSNVGKNFVRTMYNYLKEGKPLRVVYDQVGSPTGAEELAVFLYGVVNHKKYENNDGIYHFTNLGVTSWYDLTIQIGEFMGLKEVSLSPCLSDEYKTAAKRPNYSVLDTTKTQQVFGYIPRHWHTPLYITVNELKKEDKE